MQKMVNSIKIIILRIIIIIILLIILKIKNLIYNSFLIIIQSNPKNIQKEIILLIKIITIIIKLIF